MPPLTPKERALTEELDECNETVRQLRSEALQAPARIYRGLTRNESGIVALLSSMPGRVHAAERVSAHLEALNDHTPRNGVRSMQVVLCRLRAKLGHLTPPVTIESNGYGYGYSMTAESAAVMGRLLVV
jgi:DNA-binding response OmpR family regulator